MSDRTQKKATSRFDELLKMNGDLRLLRRTIKKEKRIAANDEYYCANDRWYRIYKPVVVKTAGWYARDSALNSKEDYDIAYQTLYDMLPDCRHKGMFC